MSDVATDHLDTRCALAEGAEVSFERAIIVAFPKHAQPVANPRRENSEFRLGRRLAFVLQLCWCNKANDDSTNSPQWRQGNDHGRSCSGDICKLRLAPQFPCC